MYSSNVTGFIKPLDIQGKYNPLGEPVTYKKKKIRLSLDFFIVPVDNRRQRNIKIAKISAKKKK